MFGAALIVFRETLEAALFVGIIAAATRGLQGRARWLLCGVVAGALGAVALAAGAEQIGTLADGVGQDLVNALILSVALAMLVWHCVWVSNRGAEAAADARALGGSFKAGDRAPWALTAVVALSVLREGAETVLFVAGYSRGSGASGLIGGALLGVALGIALGAVLYLGLSRIPMKRMFAVTNTLITFLAAAIASQLARALSQAGIVDVLGQTLWDTTSWLRADSPLGTLLHALFGYDPQPTGLQLGFYLSTLVAVFVGARWVRSAQTARRAAMAIWGSQPAPKVAPRSACKSTWSCSASGQSAGK